MFDQLDELSKTTVRSALLYWRAAVADETNAAMIPFVDPSLGTLTEDEIDELLITLGLEAGDA